MAAEGLAAATGLGGTESSCRCSAAGPFEPVAVDPLARMREPNHAKTLWPTATPLDFAAWVCVSSRGSHSDATDADLLSRSAGGDKRAFDEIVSRYGLFALRVASRLLGDPLLAEDVVQDAMFRAWSQASSFDPCRAQFTTWLYRIVVNLCIDQRRRRQPAPLPEHFDAVDPAASADEMMDIKERDAAFAGALKDLPIRQRAAVTLVYEEGMSGAETAQILGLSVKAVERLLARARSRLRQRLLSQGFGSTKC